MLSEKDLHTESIVIESRALRYSILTQKHASRGDARALSPWWCHLAATPEDPGWDHLGRLLSPGSLSLYTTSMSRGNAKTLSSPGAQPGRLL